MTLCVVNCLPLIPCIVPGVLLRSRLPPEVVEACKTGDREGNSIHMRPDLSLLDRFSELRDAFEAELKASQPSKDRQSAASIANAVEASITFLYTGK